MICWFQSLGFRNCDYRPRGRPDPAHLIPQQRMKRAGIRGEQLWDERAWVHACRLHHELFDHKMLRLTEEQYPEKLREFAKEIGFGFIDNRTGWVEMSEEKAA